MVDKTEFYWAIVGDSAPEPVAVTGPKGARMAYTIGCEDPFPIDTPDSSVQLIYSREQLLYRVGDKDPVESMKIPKTPTARKKEREKSERWLIEQERLGLRHHGYVGFGARADE